MIAEQSSFTLLDGPLLPNDAIEQATARAFEKPRDLVAHPSGALFVSDGDKIVHVKSETSAPKTVAQLPGEVTALCVLGNAEIAAAVAGKGVYAAQVKTGDLREISTASELHNAITALAPGRDNAVFAAKATTREAAYPYTIELFAEQGSGQVIEISPDGTVAIRAEGLRGPHGVFVTETGSVLVSETWGSAIKLLNDAGHAKPVLSNFAGYPGRITSNDNGGYIVACLSRRDPLVDFVITEKAFVQRMVVQLPPDQWIAPRLESAPEVNVPAQAGSIRLYGHVKPWAPSLSHGLVCEFDAAFIPQTSYHSRADGHRHGIISAVPWGQSIAALSVATNEVVFIPCGGSDDDK